MQLLADSNEQIEKVLGVEPSVFVAPYNRINEDTLAALGATSIRTMTANVTEMNPPFVRNVTGPAGPVAIYHFPATAKTGDLNADDTEWLGSSHTETMAEIEDSISKYGYSVVMMHPQEFSLRQGTTFQNEVDRDQLRELELLLDSVESEGYEIVTVSELANDAVVPEFPGYFVFALASGFGIVLLRGRIAKSLRSFTHLPL